ncbi:TRAP-type C4-dicarboxylate transport system permease small subunit [Pseudonocardia hierapolitana]|uniref:TRAP-type C4-dicarboxylate transport system permease small subunit n=1 Tax=Pseudonocardia hierapolitana TaxID=1128676 RepID=A0A561SLB9_9PSEU|nr:TRAP-type C4-dicarboxylate transport system permease small subunit [Pseudonocardia hierapolitana]
MAEKAIPVPRMEVSLQRFDRVLTLIENVLAASTLGLAAVIAVVAVVLRYVFGIFLFWSEEAIIYLIIYSTFLGAVITLRHNEHVNVDIFGAFLKARGRRALAVLAASLTVLYLVCIGYFAWLLLFEPFSTSTITPSLKLPLWVVEAAVPIGLTLMLLRALEMLVRNARGEDAFAEAKRSILEVEAEATGLDVREVERTRRELGDDPEENDR